MCFHNRREIPTNKLDGGTHESLNMISRVSFKLMVYELKSNDMISSIAI